MKQPNVAKKEVRQLMKAMKEAGWLISDIMSNNHIRMVFPANGKTVKLPSTPSSQRWLKSTKCRIRKIEQEQL